MWPLQDLSDSDHVMKNQEFIQRDNHKSALKYDDVYHATIIKEIQQGGIVPLALTYTNDLLHGELAPVGINDSQWSKLPEGTK